MTFPDTMNETATMPTVRRRLAGWLLPVGGAVCLLVAVGILCRFDPAGNRWFPPCVFHKLTGLHCPGCGSTRAMYQLLHGQIGAALRLNALAVLALPFLGYWVARALCGRAGRQWPALSVPSLAARGLAVGVIAFWILRNIPAWPFTWLAPG